ncbi:MAG: hypothetical protein NTW32_23225 [Chloroflexi bacterium]|nr:hypothetical protein [Chloroflexota bacterium]
MTNTLIPIYTTRGDPDAFLAYPNLFNRAGEWIGFITTQRDVYSVLGYYVGTLTDDPRIIRNRSGEIKAHVKPPQTPSPVRISAIIPLPRMMGDLPNENIDVLQDEPDRLHTLDAGELRPDLD